MLTQSQHIADALQQLSLITNKHMKLNANMSRCEAFLHATLFVELGFIDKGMSEYWKYHHYVEANGIQGYPGLKNEIGDAQEVAFRINRAAGAIPLTPCSKSEHPKKLMPEFHTAVMDIRNELISLRQTLESIIRTDENRMIPPSNVNVQAAKHLAHTAPA